MLLTRSVKYLCIALLLVSGCKKKEISFEKMDSKDQGIWTRALLQSASLSNDEDYNSAVYYLGKGVPVNVKDSNGFPATHIAVVNHNPKIAMYLLEHGADINVRDPDSATLLHYAAGAGYPSLVKYLLNHGADVNERAVHNLTPALYASQLWEHIPSDSLTLMWHYLLDAGADLNAVDDNGNNVILRAVVGVDEERYNLPTIYDEGSRYGGLCHSAGIRVHGVTTVQASFCVMVSILKQFLNNGCSPDLKNNKGLSARMYTEKYFREELKSKGSVADSAYTINLHKYADLYLFMHKDISSICRKELSIQ